MPKNSTPLARDVVGSEQSFYLTHAWLRDIRYVAGRQWRSELRDPLRLVQTLIADELDGYYQLSCGSPALIIHPRYASVRRIAFSHYLWLERKYALGVTPYAAARIDRELLLTEIVIELFDDVIENNRGRLPWVA